MESWLTRDGTVALEYGTWPNGTPLVGTTDMRIPCLKAAMDSCKRVKVCVVLSGTGGQLALFAE